MDTRVIYCGDNLEQLAKLPDAGVDLIYIDPPFYSNRNYGQSLTGTVWGETKEKRAFEDRHENTKAYIDYLRPRPQTDRQLLLSLRLARRKLKLNPASPANPIKSKTAVLKTSGTVDVEVMPFK